MCLSDKVSVSGPLEGEGTQAQPNYISVSLIGSSEHKALRSSFLPLLLVLQQSLTGCMSLGILVNLSELGFVVYKTDVMIVLAT